MAIGVHVGGGRVMGYAAVPLSNHFETIQSSDSNRYFEEQDGSLCKSGERTFSDLEAIANPRAQTFGYTYHRLKNSTSFKAVIDDYVQFIQEISPSHNHFTSSNDSSKVNDYWDRVKKYKKVR